MKPTKEQIRVGNHKIAVFTGAKILPFKMPDTIVQTWQESKVEQMNGLDTDIELLFHKDWNWINKVIEILENMGACIIIANYSKDKTVKDNLAAHVGFEMNEDYYMSIAGHIKEGNRYFTIDNLGINKLETVWETILVFIDWYNSTSDRINYFNGGKS